MSNCLRVGSRVTRRIGAWHPNATLYDKEDTISGTILEAVGHAAWHVLWDDGHLDDQTVHPSSVLKLLQVSNINASNINKIPSRIRNQRPSGLTQSDLSSEDEFMNENEFLDDCEDTRELIKRIESYDREVMEAREKISELIGTTFKPKTGDIKPLWTVVSNVDSVCTNVVDQQTSFMSLKGKTLDPVKLFWELWPGDIDAQLQKMNTIAEEDVDMKRRRNGISWSPPKWKPVSKQEFETFVALFLAAANLEQRGNRLFDKDFSPHQLLFSCSPRFDRFMSLKRFKEIRSKAAFLFADLDARSKNDKWWPVLEVETSYAEKRKRFFKGESKEWIADESMSAFCPRTSPMGDLPHLQKVPRKPKQLGTELKNIACCETGVILAVDIQKGKRNTINDDFSNKYGATARVSCRLINLVTGKNEEEDKERNANDDGTVKSASDETNETMLLASPTTTQTQEFLLSNTEVEDVRDLDEEEDVESVIFDLTEEPLFRGDAYYGSVRTAIAVHTQFNVHFLGVVKQYTSNYPKEDMMRALEGKPAGTKIVLTATVHGVRLVAIGYNQKKNDTVYLLMTEGAASTMDDPSRPRVQKFLDKYRNVCVRKVSRPKALNEYYMYCGLIDDHNRLRQGYLQLEQKWVSQSGFARIFTTIVGMNLVDTYLLCKYHKKQNTRISNKKDPDYSIKDFVQKFAYDSLRRITCHTCVIDNVISKKCSWNIDNARKVVHEDEEIPGTQLEENPNYLPPTRLRDLLYGIEENDLRTTKRFKSTVPETQLYEGSQVNLLTPNSVSNPTNLNSVHVCTQTPISETAKSSEKKPRKRRKQRTCVYCRTNDGKYKWTSYYCPACNVALCKGNCFSQYHLNKSAT